MFRPIVFSRQKYIVVDVDTQKRFFSDTCNISLNHDRCVLANIRRVMAWTRLQHIYVISTLQISDDYKRNASNHSDVKKIRYTIRNRYTQFNACDSTDFPFEMIKKYDQIIFDKRCVDPFDEPRVDRVLTQLQAREFILIGSLTEGAIKATAMGLLARRKNVRILTDAIVVRDEALAKSALKCLSAKGAILTNTQKFLGSSSLRFVKGVLCCNL